jgi:hypothetical protein
MSLNARSFYGVCQLKEESFQNGAAFSPKEAGICCPLRLPQLDLYSDLCGSRVEKSLKMVSSSDSG